MFRKRPQASLEAWQAEPRGTLKRLVFSPVQKATLGTGRARQKVPLGLHWQGDLVFRKRPQASLEAWQAEPRGTLKRLVFSPVQKATLGTGRARQKVPLGLHWQGDLVFRKRPQASLEAWQAEPRGTLKRLVFSPVQKATLGTGRARQKVPLGLHWQGDLVFRKRPQASLEAWQAEPRGTLKRLVFSPVQKATLGTGRARQKVPLGLHWQGDLVFRKRPQASLEAWQAEPRGTLKRLVFSPVQKATLGTGRARQKVPLGLHWQGDLVFRKRPQASLEAWQAEPRGTLKRLVFSPVQKATLGTGRARQKVPLGLHWQGDLVFRKRPQASLEAWQAEPSGNLEKACFFSGSESDVRHWPCSAKGPVGPSLAGGSSVSQAAPGKLGSVAS